MGKGCSGSGCPIAIIKKGQNGQGEVNVLLGVPKRAKGDFLRPLLSRWKEFMFWLLVAQLEVAFSEASAPNWKSSCGLERTRSPGGLEFSWQGPLSSLRRCDWESMVVW